MRRLGSSWFRLLLVGVLASLILSGCGGVESESANEVVAIPQTLTGHTVLHSFLARSVSSGFVTLNTQDQRFSAQGRPAGSERRSLQEAVMFPRASGLLSRESVAGVRTGLGTTEVTFEPSDTAEIFGVLYKFTGGSQIYQTYDATGTLVDDETQVDTLRIRNRAVTFSFVDQGMTVAGTINGTMAIAGFRNGRTFVLTCEDLAIDVTIDGISGRDSFAWRRSGSITVDETSYPFPRRGETETSMIAFNGAESQKLTAFDGTGVAVSTLVGADNLTMTMNLATGRVQGEVTIGDVNQYFCLGQCFRPDSNGVMSDAHLGGLQWLRAPDQPTNWFEAWSWVKAQAIDGGAWRLPRQQELQYLYQLHRPACLAVFPAETWDARVGGAQGMVAGIANPNGYWHRRDEPLAHGFIAVRPAGATNPMRIEAWQTRSTTGDAGWTEPVLVGDRGSPHAFMRILPNNIWRPLGDVMWRPGTDPPPEIQRFAATEYDLNALAHPLRFEWQGDNAWSLWVPGFTICTPLGCFPVGGKWETAPATIHYWRMIPPPGYVALGYCFTKTGRAPQVEDYYCVREDHVVRIGAKSLWSDAGFKAKFHDLNLYAPTLLPENTPGPGRELRVPTTVKGHCTQDSGHPNPGDPLFYALNLPPNKWPIRVTP